MCGGLKGRREKERKRNKKKRISRGCSGSKRVGEHPRDQGLLALMNL
jgi:hypothetical protein